MSVSRLYTLLALIDVSESLRLLLYIRNVGAVQKNREHKERGY